MTPPAIDPMTGRLRVSDVERLHQVLGGDPMTEELVLRFIGFRWQAKNLFYLPANVAAQALLRPADFIRAAKQFSEPDLPF